MFVVSYKAVVYKVGYNSLVINVVLQNDNHIARKVLQNGTRYMIKIKQIMFRIPVDSD